MMTDAQRDMVDRAFGSPAVHPGGNIESIVTPHREAQARVGVADVQALAGKRPAFRTQPLNGGNGPPVASSLGASSTIPASTTSAPSAPNGRLTKTAYPISRSRSSGNCGQYTARPIEKRPTLTGCIGTRFIGRAFPER